MTRDARNLDQNPLIIDPANVDAVLHDRPTPASPPLSPAMQETRAEYDDKTSPAQRARAPDAAADAGSKRRRPN